MSASSPLQPDRIRKVRVLVIGDSGSGKTSLVHLLVDGEPLRQPKRTVGCSVAVKLIDFPELNSAGEVVKTHPHFVELWDIGTHTQYADLRHIFYNQINGVILVHDLTAREILSAQLAQMGARGGAARHLPGTCGRAVWGTTSPVFERRFRPWLPAPALVVGNLLEMPDLSRAKGKGLRLRRQVVGNKLDMSDPSGTKGKGWRSWPLLTRLCCLIFGDRAAHDMLLPKSQPWSGDVRTSALRGVVDPAPVDKFFHTLITRRFYSGDQHRTVASGADAMHTSPINFPSTSASASTTAFASGGKVFSCDTVTCRTPSVGSLDALDNGAGRMEGLTEQNAFRPSAPFISSTAPQRMFAAPGGVGMTEGLCAIPPGDQRAKRKV
ncbi:hypothetical protein CYMTET_6579 [Cymbomonas tetramitiformis]|uniref:Uncharacterized protein n=1 Tax=Cymbomonas tetramitiformis TaxID=36881 RepID=A0AAE0GXB8_9CHLO|nr:hypothetical protein CYMTET_6579 [Cymbomonas tetramitiformis]